MDFEIVWTEPALVDFEAIIQRIAADDPDAAERMRLELLASVQVLARVSGYMTKALFKDGTIVKEGISGFGPAALGGLYN